jgi:pantetheine-phosphate adenylyltransferase
MSKIAVFPGSFDPITIGHECIIRRAALLFDELIVAIGINADKQGYFPVEKRIEWIKTTIGDLKNVSVEFYHGLTVDYCMKKNAKFIIRGLRSAVDFEFERSIGQANKLLNIEIESVFLLSCPEHTPINSSIVRDILRNGGDISKFVPSIVAKQITDWQ